MDDLRRHVDKYMQMEELAEIRNQARAEVAAKPEKSAENSYRGRPKELVPREKPPRGPSLKTSFHPPLADTTKSCRYHRNRGHSTEECSALKDKIEDLIKQGQLQGFVDRPTSSRYAEWSRRHDQPEQGGAERRPYRERSRSRGRREEEPSTQPRRVINTIAGGFAGGGSTSSTQRRHLRPVQHVHAVEKIHHCMPSITFTEADFKGIDPEKDDPMVISVEIHNCIVRKTLVDQGSSADILYWNTFKQLGIPEIELVPYDEPLVGFSSKRVKTKGYIKLSTRPSLNQLGAIVSTPNLAMKFQAESGRVITVHADQKTAREC
ncbi:uncharacterized protein LOC109811501 [Cajanus cajan]|uniref:uncharacterized protein LOC109811501 n=1 Tax=Cajanus cajan TaxID=3821 RepID=UPI00098DC0B7|nr:uncharacterized protein LOC109811501 [Cajanus cajan]